jgi:hypothetical protein
MDIYYKKNNNSKLFDQFKECDYCNLHNAQNYIPLYENFFTMNENNYNNINLNNKYRIENLEEKFDHTRYNAQLIDSCNNILKKKIFFKYSPLLDPTKYMLGKYDNCVNILDLPNISNKNNNNNNNNNNLHKKLLDTNNSAYIDGFFSYLSSLLLNNYNFYNGIDYYGSFLGIKNDFLVNIDEDIEYLENSEFFHKNNESLFQIVDKEKHKNLFRNTKKFKKSIFIENENSDLNIEIENIELENNVLELNIQNIQNLNLSNKNNNDLTIENLNLNDDSNLNINEVSNNISNNNHDSNINISEDLNNNKGEDSNNKNKRTNSVSSSTCSSRYSKTTSSNDDSKSENSHSSSSLSTYSESSSCSEEDIFISIKEFPVQTIALECCENTLDHYIENNKLKDNEWESIILQILLTLITYQHVFDFTHNDLHTNNIVYITTEKKFLYYKYKNSHYKVPTFGKIYKIIDFGRAIYKYKSVLLCSDSYADDGDANTQYNCEPYLNNEKPRIDPNYSFDLCRLGCSLFDYFIDDIDDIKKLKSPIKKIIISWIFDDNNKNILYKNNGEERYPDFKLYKMIARTVHKHTPQNVIKNELFDKYKIAKKKINNASIFNIDDLEKYY